MIARALSRVLCGVLWGFVLYLVVAVYLVATAGKVMVQ